MMSIGLLSVAITASAQGGDGRSSNFRKPTPAVMSSRLRTAAAKYQKPVRASKPVIPQTGRLSIVVNEAASRVYLTSGEDAANTQPIVVTSHSPSVISRSLPSARYNLRVSKSGYFDETRVIELEAGSRRKVVVNMRPQMAILNFKANVADAEIEIENVGRFNKPLKKYLIKPGSYRIDLRRRGYLSQTVHADLSIAGKEQSIYAVMQPLRIDTVLAQAEELISKGELIPAADLVKDVLILNSSHAKANLLFGMIEFEHGRNSSVPYFLKAIEGGETVNFPGKVRSSSNLPDAAFGLDRDAIIIGSKSRLDLNFKITRAELETVLRQDDGIVLTGAGDFLGKSIHPTVKIVSGSTEILYLLISEWRKLRK